ncbi:MAG TPA: NADPH-dependent FMN reductase [Solirubrobacteraceae bacterium]|jgi:chromate reductase|nr:NADPH-dependent FMN reductase [Solirubrobacteraceae bacterium]
MRVLGISGSLRRESHNSRLLEGVRGMLPASAELVRYEALAEIPPFNEDLEHDVPPAVAALKAAIADADAVLIATPEYNGSIPGQLKNALDWVSRPPGSSPLRGKPTAVVGASTSLFGAVWAQAELRKVLGLIGARVVDRDLPIPQALESLGEDGLPLDPAAREQLRSTLKELFELVATQPLAA